MYSLKFYNFLLYILIHVTSQPRYLKCSISQQGFVDNLVLRVIYNWVYRIRYNSSQVYIIFNTEVLDRNQKINQRTLTVCQFI
jgi:hypothetical protein